MINFIKMKLRKDIVHHIVGEEYEKYNDMGDAIVLMNLGLLIVSIPQSSSTHLRRMFGLFVLLMIFREAVSLATLCDADVRDDYRPLLGGDTRWYVLSGHLIVNVFITYIVCLASTYEIIKFLSIALTLCVCMVQIVTKEHYTKDMMITALLCVLIVKCYG